MAVHSIANPKALLEKYLKEVPAASAPTIYKAVNDLRALHYDDLTLCRQMGLHDGMTFVQRCVHFSLRDGSPNT
jgi:hypothetical protein